MKGIKKEKLLYGLYRILAVMLTVLWGGLIAYGVVRIAEKRYVYRLEYYDVVSANANAYDIEKSEILSIIKIESGFNENAESDRNAKGLMQILDTTAVFVAEQMQVEEYDLFDSTTNINFGCYYLSYLIDKFEVFDTALVAYNAGEGRVREWLKNKEFSTDGKSLNKIPYKETENYLDRFYKTKKKYENLYGKFLDK